ncbi:DNA-formamidopyrimidine glycosylase family protein [Candidatus Nitrospira bockiana]
MPELPDLAVYAENLMARLGGKTVQSVDHHGGSRLNTSHEELRNSLCNTSLVSVERSGKEIVFAFSNKAALSVHLMVTGGFAIAADPSSARFRVLTMGFADGFSLVVSDPRSLVTVNLNPLPSIAPDALEVDGTYLRRKISERPRVGGQGLFNGPSDYPWHWERLCRRNPLACQDFSKIRRRQDP